MSDAPPIPRWFRLTYRCLAGAVLAGLVGGIGHDAYGLQMPVVAIPCGAMTFFGSIAFVVLTWVGSSFGYVKTVDAVLYTIIFVMAFIVIMCCGILFVRPHLPTPV